MPSLQKPLIATIVIALFAALANAPLTGLALIAALWALILSANV